MYMDIEMVVRHAADGDERAWHELVTRYARLLRSVAAGLRVRPCDAEDAAQQTWLALRENIHALREPARVHAWLCQVMRRNCLRILTRQRAEQLADDVGSWAHSRSDDPTDELVDQVVLEQTAVALWAVVDRLPDRERQLLRALFDREERSYRQIARDLDMPIGSNGPIRMRALERLSALLADIGITVDHVRTAA